MLWKDIDHRSREYDNAPMPHSVFFTETGVAFHEGDLSRQSHGCVRLTRSAAQEFYAELQEGEVVQVVSTTSPEDTAPEDAPEGQNASRLGPVGP